MTAAQQYAAPAKLNLDLRVTGRRADGYHLLDSVFRLIDAADTLSFAVRDDGVIRRAAGPAEVAADNDLCVRAARLLAAEAGVRQGVDIHLDKHLPMGAGLGGGSSDAATTLLALNRLWGIGYDRAQLMSLGLRLGADVPFFLFGRNARATGIGEVLAPVDLPPAWYVVLVPPVAVPTREVFAGLTLTPSGDHGTMAAFPRAARRNDLQPVAVGKYPVIGKHLDWLGQHAPALMTGSGSCVFAEFATEARAREVLDRLPADMRGFVARGLDRHPLQDA